MADARLEMDWHVLSLLLALNSLSTSYSSSPGKLNKFYTITILKSLVLTLIVNADIHILNTKHK